MRKTLLTLVACFLLAGQCFAWGTGSDSYTPSRWKTYTIINDSGTSLASSVSTSIIVPNRSVILGYDINPSDFGATSEKIVAIYDGGLAASDELLGEAEKDTNILAALWFPRPRTIEKQLYVNQGANTIVTIYFE